MHAAQAELEAQGRDDRPEQDLAGTPRRPGRSSSLRRGLLRRLWPRLAGGEGRGHRRRPRHLARLPDRVRAVPRLRPRRGRRALLPLLPLPARPGLPRFPPLPRHPDRAGHGPGGAGAAPAGNQRQRDQAQPRRPPRRPRPPRPELERLPGGVADRPDRRNRRRLPDRLLLRRHPGRRLGLLRDRPGRGDRLPDAAGIPLRAAEPRPHGGPRRSPTSPSTPGR